MTTDGGIDLIPKTADLIIKYGFLGLGLILMIVIGPIIYRFSKLKYLTTATFTFGLAFVVTWGVLNVVQKYFPSLIASRRVLLSGVVLNVPTGYQVQIASDLRRAGAAYVKRENDLQADGLNNYFFMVASRQAPSCLSIAISNNNPQSEAGSSGFNIAPISESDLSADTDLVVRAERKGGHFRLQVWREVDDKQTGAVVELVPLIDSGPSCASGQKRDEKAWNWIASAFAQSNARPDQDFSIRLKSDDLLTRRNARIELSKQGPQTIELARQFLDSGNYRLQLGALVALSVMPEGDLRKLPSDITAKVRQFTDYNEETMQDTARRILQRMSQQP